MHKLYKTPMEHLENHKWFENNLTHFLSSGTSSKAPMGFK